MIKINKWRAIRLLLIHYIMKVLLERSGGFAGMMRSTYVDTKNLSPNEANELQKLIEKSEFFELSSNSSQQFSSKSQKGAADYFTYKITIQNGDNEHSMEYNDVNIQPKFKRLVDFLVKHSQK
jgi:hypothetical protein